MHTARSLIVAMLPDFSLIDWAVVALGLLLLLIGLVIFIRQGNTFSPKPLLTKNEMEFYGRLIKALPDLSIFPQVALRAFIQPGSSSGTRAYWRESGLLGAKHCDFLICHPVTLDVVAIIELDDRLHKKDKDAARDKMTASAGYVTLRFESRNRPSIQSIREQMLPHAARFQNLSFGR